MFLSFFTKINCCGTDFNVYTTAAQNALNGKNIYSENTPLSFLYPPSALLLFIPLIYTGKFAFYIWTVFSLLLFSTSYYLISKVLLKTYPLSVKLLILFLFFQSFSLQQTIYLGQVNLVVLSAIITAFYFLHKGKGLQHEVIAGALLAIATGIKIIPIFLIIYLILKKHWFATLNLFTALAFINMTSILFLKIKMADLSSFLGTISNLSLYSGQVNPRTAESLMNQSLNRFIISNSPFENGAKIIQIILIVLFLTLSINTWLTKAKSKNESAILINDWELFGFLIAYSILFFSTYTWEHHLIFLFPILLLAINRINFQMSPYLLLIHGIIFLSFLLNPQDILLLLNKSQIPKPVLVVFQHHALFALIILKITLTIRPPKQTASFYNLVCKNVKKTPKSTTDDKKQYG